MNAEAVMQELESLSKERTKKIYLSNGAREPLFGVATGEMKPIFKKTKINQPLAEQLYSTGNYDAMYFAGIIADPNAMTEADYERWMDAAYFYMLSDYVVAVTLSESGIAQQVADKWIESGEELRMSAGWSCYCWLLGNRPDSEFSESKIASMLDLAEKTINDAPERTKYAMSNFIYTVGVSYLTLHDKAVKTAQALGAVEVKGDKGKSKLLRASDNIQKAVDKGQIGFKRKHVRC
ncbi:MAG: alkylation repair protein [Paenibacillaceae bacterium]|nr:alkylation repair protein [Paenibacillaceae bacterium]